MSAVMVTGLDGATPLGFLAALGLLRVFDEKARAGQTSRPRLAWTERGRWRPVLHGPDSLDAVVDEVMADVQACRDQPLVDMTYIKVEKKGPKQFRGLKPQVAVLRGWLWRHCQDAEHDDRALRTLEYMAALMAENATDKLKKAPTEEELRRTGTPVDDRGSLELAVQPTAFDFTTRNTQFLDQLQCIARELSRDWVVRALRDGLPVPEAGRTMGWDSTADAPGALFEGQKRGTHPAAEWLAFRGLVYFPVFGAGQRLRTTACRGRRLEGAFVWPLWSAPATASSIRSLLSYPKPEDLSEAQRRALGVSQVIRARFTKGADNRTAIFAPTEPV